MLLHLIGISFARDIFEVLDHMTDMWIFTTISRAFSSFSEVHEPESQRELKVCEQEGQWERRAFCERALLFLCKEISDLFFASAAKTKRHIKRSTGQRPLKSPFETG